MTDKTPPLTPHMAELLARIRRANRPPFHTLAPRDARIAYRMGAEILDLPRAPLPRVEDLQAAGRPARLYAPGDGRLPVLLYLHGGGFTIGDLETHDSLCRQLSLRSGAAVLSLDYRLAPEHRFPAAVDDAWAGLAWLHEQADALGLDGSRLAVGGDSAGGTLAAGAAFFARERGLPLALQLLITPGTDSHMSHDSHRRFAEGFLLDAKGIEWFFAHYIDPAQRGDWRFAPLHADDHGGLAPAAVLLAEADPLVDEGLAYADTLRAAGVPVQLELTRGVTHDFIKMGRALPEARAALDFCAAAIREHLQP
ncbi:MAG: alpha/beta hydrolase [Roseateles sp.]|uniref:alpha/beta hydrolase n=1 Tax=Roseateles sp. TaxID=1971397 RepID=UPI0039EB09EF